MQTTDDVGDDVDVDDACWGNLMNERKNVSFRKTISSAAVEQRHCFAAF